MRRALLVLAAVLGCVALGAQSPEDYHFLTDGETVSWQRVFQAADSCAAGVFLQNLHARKDCVDVLSEVPGVISMDLRFRPVAVAEDLGYDRPRLPAYITAGDYSAHATIQLKPDRYRVTVEGVRMVLPGFGDTRLEVFALKRGGWASKFTPAPADIIDAYLGGLFDGLDVISLDDEW
jgi:hypothetical protein